MRSERGSLAIWMMGLAALLLLFGGISVDLWRALAMQRELAAVADSAAIAAAFGIDEEIYRATGELVLSSSRSTSLAMASVGSQRVELERVDVALAPDGLSVEVIVVDELELGLLGVFAGQTAPIELRATAVAFPLVVP